MLWSGILLVIFLITSCIDNDEHGKSPRGEPILQLGKGAPATKAIDIVSGEAHVCAHLEDYTIKCWGDNQYGALNIKSARNAQKKYYDVSKAEFSQITARSLHTCGILRAPPYEGIPVCFGQENESLDVPHERVKEIAAGGGFTCIIKQDDTLSCIGMSGLRIFTDTRGDFTIKPSELLKWGIDPTSGAEAQDYSTKRFKGIKAGAGRVCAQGLDDNIVRCMGTSNHKGGMLGSHRFIDYDTGGVGGGASALLDTGHIFYASTGCLFDPISDVSHPENLKYKKMFYDNHGYLTASGNKYDYGTLIPENTLITTIGYLKEGMAGMTVSSTSYKAKRVGIWFYLTEQGKVGCLNCTADYVKPYENSDVIKNIPREITE